MSTNDYQHNLNTDTYAPAEALPPSHAKSGNRAWLWLVGGLLAAVAAAVIGVGMAAAGQNSGDQKLLILNEAKLEAAKDNCASTVAGIQVGDSGRSLTIDGAGLYSGPPIERVACVLAALDTPDSVIARIDATRALDGMQTAAWDGFTASWTYHPDDGLWMVIEEE